jgi:hypothetical protein
MKRSRFTEEQIIGILREQEERAPGGGARSTLSGRKSGASGSTAFGGATIF